MTAPSIEDYALIGDCETAALVSRTGSIDWLCLPRFDSPACFAGLLGTPEHGCWRLAPAAGAPAARRHYHAGTLVLETEFETAEGRPGIARAGRPDGAAARPRRRAGSRRPLTRDRRACRGG